VKTKLEKGALVADVGCGRGRAIIKLAQAFPNSKFVGYDIFEPAIEHAKSQSVSAGVSDRISFKQTDISKGFPPEEHYDLITTFDVIHDMTNPQAALRSIRQALKPDGTYLWLEINSKDRLEDNFGAMGALFYCWSIMYCMTTSLAEGGQGLGTLGMPPSKVKEYCNVAGFTHVRKLPLDNPFLTYCMKSGCNITKGFSYPRSARHMPMFLEIRRTATTDILFNDTTSICTHVF
jgi:ubiquinone/menaquinone biosynthesis C-methylase UbiE